MIEEMIIFKALPTSLKFNNEIDDSCGFGILMR